MLRQERDKQTQGYRKGKHSSVSSPLCHVRLSLSKWTKEGQHITAEHKAHYPFTSSGLDQEQDVSHT